MKKFDDYLIENDIIVSTKKIKRVPNELDQGRKIEKEHKPTYEKVKKYFEKTGKMILESEFYESIAKDHLKENKNYYSYLKDMEETFEDK